MSLFDYSTVIGRDPKLFRFHVKNVLDNTCLPRDKWNFNVFVYFNENIPRETTDEILEICDENDIASETHYEAPGDPFINRLYVAWNRVQVMGRAPLTIRGGSDQTFYPNSFEMALEKYNFCAEKGECVVNFQTLESTLAHNSRHYIVDAGTTPEEYNEEAFVSFCNKIIQSKVVDIHEAMQLWDGKPGAFGSSLGYPHYRGDGCSWIQSKRLFNRIGPMPAMGRGVTGDVWLHDMYELNGVKSYIAGDAITYHFVKGESR